MLIVLAVSSPIALGQSSPATEPDRWMLGFLDVETTGLVPGHHEMIDIGLVVTDLEGTEVDRLFLRIMPEHPERLAPQAAAVNGFSVERWRELDAVPGVEAVEAISDWITRLVADRTLLLTAFNVAFDAAFLDHLFRAAGSSWRDLPVSFHLMDLPSMAWALGHRQLFSGDLPAALGLEPETDDPLRHTGLTGALFNAALYRRLLEVDTDGSARPD